MLDRTLSINEIKGWTAPRSELRSSLVERHEAALATPLSELRPSQIAMLIRQRTELELVLPLALDILAEQPLIDGELYCGDLLNAVLGLPPEFWRDHSSAWYEVNAILG